MAGNKEKLALPSNPGLGFPDQGNHSSISHVQPQAASPHHLVPLRIFSSSPPHKTIPLFSPLFPLL